MALAFVDCLPPSLVRWCAQDKNEKVRPMAKNDATPMQPGDIGAAIALLTRLPAPRDSLRGADAAWAWPIAGALVGLIAALAGALAMALNLPPMVAAAAALTVQIFATGAMHEDGLADCADGFWGGWERACRLEIMHDSRIGTYGVLALALSLILRVALLAALFHAGTVYGALVATAALSRAPMVALMRRLPAARNDGLSKSTGRPNADTELLAAAAALLIALVTVGFAALPATLIAAAAAFGLARIALAKIDGQTGDVLGASQQIAEIALLASFTALLT
jgi:adenosylcobinamide-GDP ribazoletransferase